MARKEPGMICDFSMIPLDKGASFSPYVSRSLDIIAASGLPYRLGPMSTAVEGSFDACMDIVRACFEAMAEDSDRVSCTLRFDFRRGRMDGMRTKMASVQEKASTPLNT